VCERVAEKHVTKSSNYFWYKTDIYKKTKKVED